MYKSDALQPDSALARKLEGVRLRNALLLQPSTHADFDWTPDDVPADFMRETRAPLPLFTNVVSRLELAGLSDWEKACRLASHLTERAQDKGPIQSDLATTYAHIRRGAGHCADFVKTYLALAHAAGIFVRQWAFTHNGFGGNGHVLAEVWDPLRGKWLMLDVYNNFHALDPETRQPLTALEFRDSVLGLRPAALIEKTGAGRPGFVHHARLLEYYRRGAGEWHLIWGNAVYGAERNVLVRLAMRAHPALGQVTAWLAGMQPGIRIYVTAGNRAAVDALTRLGQSARLALRSSAFLFATVLALIVVMRSV